MYLLLVNRTLQQAHNACVRRPVCAAHRGVNDLVLHTSPFLWRYEHIMSIGLYVGREFWFILLVHKKMSHIHTRISCVTLFTVEYTYCAVFFQLVNHTTRTYRHDNFQPYEPSHFGSAGMMLVHQSCGIQYNHRPSAYS